MLSPRRMMLAGAMYLTMIVRIVFVDDDCTFASSKNRRIPQDRPTNSVYSRPPTMSALFRSESAASKNFIE